MQQNILACDRVHARYRSYVIIIFVVTFILTRGVKITSYFNGVLQEMLKAKAELELNIPGRASSLQGFCPGLPGYPTSPASTAGSRAPN